ncbi:MAG: sugar phosphate isomerase/epimerase [SAR202 cluster bacterium]|nr:sugar phosphate isomerase/epimerase [SAR202 cluster bacterium]
MDITSYATVGFYDRGLETALDAIAAAGFRQVEVLSNPPHMSTPPEGNDLSEFLSRLRARGLSARSMHAPTIKTVLAAPNEEWRAREVALLARYLRLAGELGAKEIVIHPNPNPKFVPYPDDPALHAVMVACAMKSLDELVPVAEKAGVCMALENIHYPCRYPYRTVSEIRELVQDYPAKHVGIALDTGHSALEPHNVADDVRIAGDRLRATHIHDVKGHGYEDDHRAPGLGILDWAPIVAALREISYAGAWTFEVIEPVASETPEEMARVTREWARSHGLC